ncbi:MAG: hypothetical protein IPN79_05565 [Saprospiraceae bacterium]|nr:hypothetical protein [Saprospiraceae bacterium]
MKIYIYFVVIAISFSCARPCPKDIKLDEVFFTQKTSEGYLPKEDPKDVLIFQNSSGVELRFTNQNPKWNTTYRIEVETLCERGDFLDRTTQTKYIDAPGHHAYYVSTDQMYTLAIDASVQNAGQYGNVSDTILYDFFSVWGQKIGTPAFTGGASKVTSDRGNGNRLPEFVFANDNMVMIADTTIEGRSFKNIFTHPYSDILNYRIFYSREKGIEAFLLNNGEFWFLKE